LQQLGTFRAAVAGRRGLGRLIIEERGLKMVSARGIGMCWW
jgi:hypothetical protein